MEVSYMKGMLEKPEEFTNLASFYLYRKNPVMSARVLENAISDENIIFTKANSLKIDLSSTGKEATL